MMYESSPGYRFPLLIILLLGGASLWAEPLYSPTWGFSVDLPEGYQFFEGDGKDHFSFVSPGGAKFDLAAYAPGIYASAGALAEDAGRKIRSRGEKTVFVYQGREAVLMELEFPDPQAKKGDAPLLTGWGLCLEMPPPLNLPESGGAGDGQLFANAPGGAFLLALAYGPPPSPPEGGRPPANAPGGSEILHLSALDSLAPGMAERLVPGPITSFAYPRGKLVPVSLGGGKGAGASYKGEALFGEHDAEAAQALVDREYQVLRLYAGGPLWKEAWIRFYRAIHRDSFERLANAAFVLAPLGDPFKGAEELLHWVQSFDYERDLEGSDFVNLVSAVTGGRGDCDSRALLWAIVLERANIPAAIMVSAEYGHAMGLADLPGPGARFGAGGKQWLVAETTAAVGLGLIGQNQSDPAKWLGVVFE